MRRTTSLRRSTRLKPRRETPRKSGRVRDEAYLQRVRELPCYVCSKSAPSDPDHMGPRPFGRKADDDTSVPMCRLCHQKRTDGKIPDFSNLNNIWNHATKAAMRKWCDRAIAATQARLGLVKGDDK